MSPKQLSYIPQPRSNQRFFGGSLLVGRRKGPRPINTKEAVHFVLRSQFGFGRRSFRNSRNIKTIERILEKASLKYRVKIYRKAIQSNHIHLVIKVATKESYRAFIAVISGRIASHIMDHMSFNKFLLNLALEEDFGLVSRKPGEGVVKQHKGQAFWEFRPFSRLLYWGKDYNQTLAYLLKNTLEAIGFILYKKRSKNYAYEKELKLLISHRAKIARPNIKSSVS